MYGFGVRSKYIHSQVGVVYLKFLLGRKLDLGVGKPTYLHTKYIYLCHDMFTLSNQIAQFIGEYISGGQQATVHIKISF